MSKTVLLATAAVFVLAANTASSANAPAIGVTGAKASALVHKAKGAKMLYNQNSNSNNTGLDSQNYTSAYSKTYNAAGADDFIVPKKAQWTVSEVDVSGLFYNGSGPAISENVTFYNDNNGVPGTVVKGGSLTNLDGTDSGGSYTISLGKKGVTLKSGHYWVSVTANCGFLTGCGQWGWYLNRTIKNDPAVWENPGNGFGTGCTTWGTIAKCEGGAYTGDFMFDLQGSSKKK
jgi:hypothetical protein